MTTLVDVILPIRGNVPYLEETLQSINAQDFQDFKLILVCENVNLEYVNRIFEKLAFKHTTQVLEVTIGTGISTALNVGIGQGTSKYIARIDGDDRMVEKRLMTQIQFMESHLEVGILGSQANIIDSNGKYMGVTRLPNNHEEIESLLIYRNALVHPSVMIRREILKYLNGYNPKYDGAEDYELWTRAVPFTKFYNLEVPLIQYRIHENQISMKHSQTITNLELEIQRKYMEIASWNNFSSSRKKLQIEMNGFISTLFFRNERPVSNKNLKVKCDLLIFLLLHPVVTCQTLTTLNKYKRYKGDKK